MTDPPVRVIFDWYGFERIACAKSAKQTGSDALVTAITQFGTVTYNSYSVLRRKYFNTCVVPPAIAAIITALEFSETEVRSLFKLTVIRGDAPTNSPGRPRKSKRK